LRGPQHSRLIPATKQFFCGIRRLPVLATMPFLNFELGNHPAVSNSPCMPQPHIDVRYVANLARLELNDEEIATFQVQLDAILGYVETLSQLDVSGIEATAHAVPVFGRMRTDDPHTSLPPQAVLLNAPDQAQGQIRVPKVVADA
jgi:aspartyl-tRNA(Asn)/glutamyl-tRNA(Gln) amidotransferase subunit C